MRTESVPKSKTLYLSAIMSDYSVSHISIWQYGVFGFFLCVIGFSLGCNRSTPQSIDRFYYPVNDLNEGLVYHYQTITKDQPPISSYWLFKSNIINGEIQFTGQYYDATKTVGQFFRQRIVSTGALLEDYKFYVGRDTSDHVLPIDVEIDYPNAFPFEVYDTIGVYLYKLSFIAPGDSSINTIIRNRRFVGYESWNHNGKSYPAIKFRLLERIENDNNGVLTIDMKGYEIYAEGIGLVFSKKESMDGTSIEERLIERMKVEEFQ